VGAEKRRKGEKCKGKNEMPPNNPSPWQGEGWEGLFINSPVSPSLERRGI